MNIEKKTFFDDIKKTLVIKNEYDQFANISKDIINKFHGHESDSFSSQVISNSIVNKSPSMNNLQPTEQQSLASIDLSLLDLKNLKKSAETELSNNKSKIIFGVGNVDADLMFIGEAPTIEDERQGIPFSGTEGQMLTKMINAMGFQRSEIYITTLIKYRSKEIVSEESDIQVCLPYLKEQIKHINPKVIVTFGGLPLKYLLNKVGLSANRGVWGSYNGVHVMPTFHPTYLLRVPEAKRDTWNDLKQVMQVFKSHQ